MSLGSMWNEVTGVVPNIPPDYAKKCVIRAWADVRRKNLWSFLMFDSNWTSPGLINTGTVTVTQGSPTVTFNSTATTALNNIGLFPSSITQRQFRVGIGTIYNIWAWNSGTGVATLDRNYQESSGTNVSYMVYQCYYAVPMQDFWEFKAVRDIVNFNVLNIRTPRNEIDRRDPQRSIFYIPTHVIPYQEDMNPASSTYRFKMYELWGGPVSQLTYQLFGLRKGVELVKDVDQINPEVGEDCVVALASYYGYQWCESNWKKEWGTKPNFQFLMKEILNNNPRDGNGLYNRLFREYRMQDRAAVDNFLTKLERGWRWPNPNGWYSSIGQVANPGQPW